MLGSASLRRAARRLNPAVELDVDIVAVTRGAIASTPADWSTATLTNTASDSLGAVRLSESASPVTIFQAGNAGAATHKYHWRTIQDPLYKTKDAGNMLWLDFFPDAAVLGAEAITLKDLTIVLGRKDGSDIWAALGGTVSPMQRFVITVTTFDENWNRNQVGDPFTVLASAVNLTGTTVTVPLRLVDRRITAQAGRLRSRTGSGRDNAGAERTADFVFEGQRKVSHLTVARGFSIGIHLEGPNVGMEGAWLGALDPVGTYPAFDPTTFWRVGNTGATSERSCGPFSPDADGTSGGNPLANPGYGKLETGAVPGYGARNTEALNGSSVPYGQWGMSREVQTAGAPRVNTAGGWQQPFHQLRAVAFAASGTLVRVFDLGASPTGEVHCRFDTSEPQKTSVTFTVRGKQLVTDAWTSLGTVTDGQVFAAGTGYRYYELTATLTASASGLASPVLHAVTFTERTRFAVYRYMADVDSTSTIDPVTAQSEIGELKLTLLKPGRDARDLVTTIATGYAPSTVEAWVYARETVTGKRTFLNLYRLENREPEYGAEGFTFVSGMDRLTVVIPQKQVTFDYPSDGSNAAITSVSYNAGTHEVTIGVAGTPFASANVGGFRYQGKTGVLAGTNWRVTAQLSSSTFKFVLEDSAQTPLVGDTFQLHSDTTIRNAVDYAGQDFAAVYGDILANQAGVPTRYRGHLPATTGRTTPGRLEPAGMPALDALQHVALHCGGAPAWVRGAISFVDLYGAKDAVEVWTERDYSDVTPITGMARRMPSIGAQYGYDFGAGAFAHEVTYDDGDALQALGRANLYDVYALPDELAKWNDAAEAQYLSSLLLGAWSTGVRLWKVTLPTPRLWLEQGDAVSIATDVYTDRRPGYDSTGADIGSPIKGRTSALGVIVGKNLWGTEFVVAIRGLSAIQSSSTDGVIDSSAGIACPTIALGSTHATLTTRLTLMTGTITFTPPVSAYYRRMEFDVVNAAGGPPAAVQATASPATYAASAGSTYTVTPYLVTTTGARIAGTPQTYTFPEAVMELAGSTLHSGSTQFGGTGAGAGDRSDTDATGTLVVRRNSTGTEGTRAILGTYTAVDPSIVTVRNDTTINGLTSSASATDADSEVTGTPLVTAPAGVVLTYFPAYDKIYRVPFSLDVTATPVGFHAMTARAAVRAAWSIDGGSTWSTDTEIASVSRSTTGTTTGASQEVPLTIAGAGVTFGVKIRLTPVISVSGYAGSAGSVTLHGGTVNWKQSSGAGKARRGVFLGAEPNRPLLTPEAHTGANIPATTDLVPGEMFQDGDLQRLSQYNGTIIRGVQGRHVLSFNAGNADLWTSQPAALSEFILGRANNRIACDLTSYKRARLSAGIGPNAGIGGSELRVQYSTDGGATWAYLDGSTGPAVSLSATGMQQSAWATITSAAHTEVWLRCIGINGNGTNSPQFSVVSLELE